MTMHTAIPWSILRYEENDNEPTVSTPGETVIWERGEGSYDLPNSSLDGNYWTTTKTTGTTGETATYAYADITWNNPDAGSGECKLETNAMPELTEMSEIVFRGVLYAHADLDGGGVRFKALGITIKELLSNGTQTDDSVWKLVKNDDQLTWDVYDDDVLTLEDQTPSTNEIEGYVGGSWDTGGGGSTSNYARIYDITVDGGTYLLTRSDDGKNYRVTLKSYS